MRAIIVAAGLGKRLRPLTDSLPKCMLKIGEKSIIQHQVDILTSLGIEEIVIIKGYCQEKVFLEGQNPTYFINKDYKNNNILESLFYAEKAINGRVIILYSDIIFDREVVKQLIESQDEISLVVDSNWQNNYIDRNDNPMEAAEFVVLGENSKVSQVGKIYREGKVGIAGEFIGMMKLGSQGSKIFKTCYHSSRKKYKDNLFHGAESIKVAYLTDLLQELIDNAVPVFCVTIRGGWREIDTIGDFKKALDFFENSCI